MQTLFGCNYEIQALGFEEVSEEADAETMFRFRHFQFTSDEHAKEPEQIILESKLWCADPRSFNDPFDCTPNFILREIAIEEQLRRASQMIRRRNIPDGHPLAIRLLDAARNGGFNSPEMQAELPRGMQSAIHASSVCCFNRAWDDPRMWAQYADNHRGYCLQFELDGSWSDEAVPMPVKYTENRPEIDLATDTMADKAAAWQYVEDAIFTKSRHWEGEQEVRLFRQGIPPGLFAFPQHALKAVFLGLKIEPVHAERLVAAVKRRENQIPIYRLIPHRTKYAFDLEEVA